MYSSKVIHFVLKVFTILSLIFINSIQSTWFNNNDYDNNRFDNTLSCPPDRICVPVEHCAEIKDLLNESTIPIHRFRQLICGYVGINVKICCNYRQDLINNHNYNHTDQRESKSNGGRSCGNSLVKSKTSNLGSYPFVSRIGFINLNDGSVRYSCSGTILNERTVLTTANCALASSDDYKINSVLVGEFDTASNPDCNEMLCAHCTESYNISYIVKHPNFNPDTLDHNVALLRLSEPLKFSLTVQPICYSDQQVASIGDLFLLIGWGKSSLDRENPLQRTILMRILRTQRCYDTFNSNLSVDLCVVGEEEPCTGFNGSPLIYQDRSGYSLIGILSFGSSCDVNRNSPVAFVNIQKYALWISENS